MLDAAALAAILDPERKDTRLWGSCLYCCKDTGHHYWCTGKDKPARYIGPPDLHTAREHAWRMEEWLIERGCRIYRNRNGDELTEVLRDDEGWMCYPTNHTAALVAAIERISNG